MKKYIIISVLAGSLLSGCGQRSEVLLQNDNVTVERMGRSCIVLDRESSEKISFSKRLVRKSSDDNTSAEEYQTENLTIFPAGNALVIEESDGTRHIIK